MKNTIKLLCKCLLVVLFFLMTPFFEGVVQHLSMSDYTYFSQFNPFKNASLVNSLNILPVVSKEHIPMRETDIDELTPVPPIYPSNNEKKRIYIYSTHQSETYADSGNVIEASLLLKAKLENYGYDVIVESGDFVATLKEAGLDYNSSYLISRNFLIDALVEQGDFDFILDFHRDSLPREKTFIEKDGKSYAVLMPVIGVLSDHTDKIQAMAQTIYDKSNQLLNGIMKPPLLREAYYNQDVSEKMILIEVGSDTNTYQEVVNSVDILATALKEVMQ